MLKKQFKNIVLGLTIIFFLFFVSFPALPAIAQNEGYGLTQTAGVTEGLKNGDPQTMIGNIIGAVLTFVGILFLILVIYGGLLWMTARGNEQQIEKAKNLIGAAVVGLIIVLSAYAITAFIGNALT